MPFLVAVVVIVEPIEAVVVVEAILVLLVVAIVVVVWYKAIGALVQINQNFNLFY